MLLTPFDYVPPVFRPPSEAASLILQVTLGCSRNKCAFCEMYTTKQFKARNENDIINEIETYSQFDNTVRKVFLADGNPMVLSTRRLLNILAALNKSFPYLRRISAYALPSDLLSKSVDELKELYEAGLKLLYIGIESGDDELLKLINKGETYNSTVEGLLKSQSASIHSSVMIINGLGGKKYSNQHAINSARILNEIQPEFASTLILSFPFGVSHYIKKFTGEYIPMTTTDLLEEQQLFIENTNLNATIFRSDHASNYLSLKGILSRDKDRFISQLQFAIEHPKEAGLRPEWMRGL